VRAHGARHAVDWWIIETNNHHSDVGHF